MKITGTIFSNHISKPKKVFYVQVLRPVCFNVLFKPERLEHWRVLAEDSQKALKVAQYHFCYSDRIQLISKKEVSL